MPEHLIRPLPQTVLSKLLKLKSADFLVALVEHPALPASDLVGVLSRVKANRSHELHARLAASRILPAVAATALSGDRNIDVCLALRRNRIVPLEVLDELAGDRAPSVRLAATMNQGASVELATAIVESQVVSARNGDLLEALGVVERRNDLDPAGELPPDALDRLSKSRVREPDMHRIVAEDECIGPRTQTRPPRSADDLARSAVTKKTSAPTEALTVLGTDSVSFVRATAAANTSLDPWLLAALVQDEETEVRARGAANPRLDLESLRELFQDDEHRVHTAAYRHSSTRPENRAKVSDTWERAWGGDRRRKYAADGSCSE